MKHPEPAERLNIPCPFVAAAIRVLKASITPLHYSEITDRTI